MTLALPSTVAGTADVVRFNWPKYVGAAALLPIAALVASLGLPSPVIAAVWLVSGAGLLWTTTSLAATWWVYDHRRVYDSIARDLVDIGDWASLHAGFDASTPVLTSRIGRPPVHVVALSGHAGPSLRRARGAAPSPSTITGAVNGLPMESATLTTMFATFAAHEVRDHRDQEQLFAELHRVLRPGGRLVLAEHHRDLANFAVYGPGAFHFQSAHRWTALADGSGFTLESDTKITPFVRRVVWRR
jgi:SAM-dependent methyltransferase